MEAPVTVAVAMVAMVVLTAVVARAQMEEAAQVEARAGSGI